MVCRVACGGVWLYMVRAVLQQKEGTHSVLCCPGMSSLSLTLITIPGNPAPPLETRGPTDAASVVGAEFAFFVVAAGNTRRCVGETAPPDGGSGGGGEGPSRAGFPGFAIVSKETVGPGSATAGVAVFAFFVDAAGNTRRCVGETAPPDGGSGGSGGDLDTIVVDGEKREPETGNQLGAPPPQLGGVARPQPTGALWRRRRRRAAGSAVFSVPDAPTHAATAHTTRARK